MKPRAAAVVLVTAVVLAYLLYRFGGQRVVYDADSYYQLAVLIATNGVFGYSIAPGADAGILPILLQVKPNGYPFFLAFVGVLSTFDVSRFHTVVFTVQLAIYLGVCYFAARRIGRVFGSEQLGTALFALTALNVFLLIYATELLSDLLSAALVYFAVVLTVPSRGRRFSTRDFILSGLVVGLATVLRSANVAVIGALALLWLARALLVRDVRWQVAPVVALACALPFVPQVVNNYLAFKSTSPFVARNEYAGDLMGGAASLTYFTVDIPEQPPQWIAVNPFLAPTPGATIDDVISHQPAGYAATLLVHGFALLDQSHPFAYVIDLAPWYRWPAAIAGFVFLAIAGSGLWLGARTFGRCLNSPAGFAFLAVGVTCAALLVIYLLPHVESRYSLPVYPLLSLPAAYGVQRLFGAFRRRHTVKLASWFAGVAIYVGLSVLLSMWIESLERALL